MVPVALVKRRINQCQIKEPVLLRVDILKSLCRQGQMSPEQASEAGS
jgi:hypothetical protein